MPTYLSAIDNTLVVPIPALTFKIANGSGAPTDFSHLVEDIKIVRPWNGQARFQASFENYNMPTPGDKLDATTLPYTTQPVNLLHGSPPNTAADTGYFRHHNQTTKNAITINLQVLEQNCPGMPQFLGGGYQDATPQGKWTGYDYQYFLDVQNQWMPDIVETSPAQGAISTYIAIANQFGISSVDCRNWDLPSVTGNTSTGGIALDGFQIRQLRRDRGTPRKWCSDIAEIYKCGQRMQGNTLICEPIPYQHMPPKTSAPPTNAMWGYKAGVNFEKFEWRESEPPPYNRVTVNRLDPQRGIIGQANCAGQNCPGDTINITLSPPSLAAIVAPVVNNGTIQEWTFWSKGAVVAGPGQVAIYLGGTPVDQITAFYEPTISVTVGSGFGNTIAGAPPESSYGYNIVVYGSNPNNFLQSYKMIYPNNSSNQNLALMYFNRVFTFTQPTPTQITRQCVILTPLAAPWESGANNSQTRYGILEDFTNIENPIIPDKQTMDNHGYQTLLEHERHTFMGELTTPFVNPSMNPGDWVQLEAPLEGFADLTIWFIDQITYIFSGGFWSMSLSLSAGLWVLQ